MFKYGNDFFFGNSFIEKIIKNLLVRTIRRCDVRGTLMILSKYLIFSFLYHPFLYFSSFSFFLVLSHKGEVVEAVAIVSPLVVASE